MSSEKQHRSRFAFLAFTVLTVGALVLYAVLQTGDETFPALPVGAYVGTVTGVDLPREEQRTWYVEKNRSSSSLLVVILAESWNPQFVETKRLFGRAGNEGRSTQEVPFAPLSLRGKAESYRFIGVGEGRSYRGTVIRADGARGSWALHPFTASPVEGREETRGVSMGEWLTLKAKELGALRELRASQALLEESEKRRQTLKEYLDNEDALKARAEEKRQALVQELKQLENEKESVSKKVSALVSELGLLARITARGRAISLARKTALRENKWYAANWKAQEDTSGLEEFLGAHSGVDLPELERGVERAREKAQLERQIVEERRKIQRLRNAQRRPMERQQAPTFPGQPDREQDDSEGGFWDRLWGSGGVAGV